MRYGKRQMLLNGEWMEGSKDDTFSTINPANREVLAEVARGYEADIDQAVLHQQLLWRRRWGTFWWLQEERLRP